MRHRRRALHGASRRRARCRRTGGSRRTSRIGQLAAAVQAGPRSSDALAVARAGGAEIEFIEVRRRRPPDRRPAGQPAGRVADQRRRAARSRGGGDADTALHALERHRLLCAHRHGPRGVDHWGPLAARWVADVHPVTPRADGRYAGEPLLVTTNDYDVGLYNGDTGVVVSDGDGGLVAAFGRGGRPIMVPLVRLGAIRPLNAMTVHRSQGSQFARITVVLPPARSAVGDPTDPLHRADPSDDARPHHRVSGRDRRRCRSPGCSGQDAGLS